MDFKNLINRLISNPKRKNIPQKVLRTFWEQFDNSLNIEWSKNGENYEAIFYRDELEHIARFNEKGELESLKTNLPLDTVPEQVKSQALATGELMNAIAIQQGKVTNYELIVRDETQVRYFLLLTTKGEVIEKEKL